MPTNRTRRKRNRADLDEFKLGELIKGPSTCLLAGLGYCVPETRQFYREATKEQQQAILDEMRADWRLHSQTVIAASDGAPWAQTKFGDPDNG